MKIKKSHAHPDSLHNYLVNSTVVKRERYYLECELNNLYSLILSDANLDEWMKHWSENIHDYLFILSNESRESFGVRGFLYDFVIECNWDVEDFIHLYRKRLGKV